MLGELVRGIIPANWRRYTVPRGCTVIQWITDFSNRVKQLQQVSQLVSTCGAKELQVGSLINEENRYFCIFYTWLYCEFVYLFTEFPCVVGWSI